MASGPRTTRRTMIFKVRSWFLLTRPCSHKHQECCSRLAKTNLILLGTLLRVTIWTALISYLSSLFSQLLVHMMSTQCPSTAPITDTAISKVRASLSTIFTRSMDMLWCKSPMTWCFNNLRRHLQSTSIRDPSLWLAQHSQALINMPLILLRASTGHGQLFRTQYLVWWPWTWWALHIQVQMSVALLKIEVILGKQWMRSFASDGSNSPRSSLWPAIPRTSAPLTHILLGLSDSRKDQTDSQSSYPW